MKLQTAYIKNKILFQTPIKILQNKSTLKENRCKLNQYFHITVTDHTYHTYYSTFTKNHYFLLINPAPTNFS